MGSNSNSKSMAGATSHVCECCKKGFLRKYHLVEHRKIHRPKTDFKCSLCDYTTNFKKHLYNHIRTHTKEQPYKCGWPNCNLTFGSHCAWWTHQKMVHKKLKKLKCVQCPYETGNKYSLQRHLANHSDLKPWSCDLCPFRTKGKRNLKSHHVMVHLKLKPFSCQQPNCSYSSSLRSLLKRHQLVHQKKDESLFKFQCTNCPFKARLKKHLDEHLRAVHSEVKNWTCTLCPFKAKWRANLKKHGTIHQEEKPFKCNFCDYAANFQGVLDVHVRGHTGETPYSCKNCPYQTKSSSILYTHLKRCQRKKMPENGTQTKGLNKKSPE